MGIRFSQSTGLLLPQHFQLGNKLKEKQLLKQWEDLGLSLGHRSNLSSSSLTLWQCPPEGWQLSQGLAQQSLAFLWQPDPFREFLCSLPSLSPGKPECTSPSPYYVVSVCV